MVIGGFGACQRRVRLRLVCLRIQVERLAESRFPGPIGHLL